MIETLPKISNQSVGKCPACGHRLFEELEEKGNYHPDNTQIYYQKNIVCCNCDFIKTQE